MSDTITRSVQVTRQTEFDPNAEPHDREMDPRIRALLDAYLDGTATELAEIKNALANQAKNTECLPEVRKSLEGLERNTGLLLKAFELSNTTNDGIRQSLNNTEKRQSDFDAVIKEATSAINAARAETLEAYKEKRAEGTMTIKSHIILVITLCVAFLLSNLYNNRQNAEILYQGLSAKVGNEGEKTRSVVSGEKTNEQVKREEAPPK